MASTGFTESESLEFTIVVDNNVQWMSKLPPGFSSELRGQLGREPPIDPLTSIPFVDLDHYCCGAHGLSILITTYKEGKPYRTLFDTGPDARSLERNLDSLKINLSSIDRVVLSHWHRDHSGGLLEFLKIRKQKQTTQGPPIVVDVHPVRPIARGFAVPPKYDTVVARLPEDPTFAEIEATGAIIEKNGDGKVTQGGTVFISGEIPRKVDWERGLPGSMKWNEEGTWVPDREILDERYLVVDITGKGLVIFSACSHAGICNVIADAVERFGRPVYAIVGGLHLVTLDMHPRIEPTVQFIKEKLGDGIKYIVPLHCTGLKATMALVNAFGDAVVEAGVGMQATL